MNRYEQSIMILALLVTTLVFLSGCDTASNSPSLYFSTIDSPRDLPTELSRVQIFFSRNQNDQTSVHISSLNREVESTIILDNEGGKVKLSPTGSYLAFRFGEWIDGKNHSGIWIRDLKEGVERKVILWPEEDSVVQLNNPNFFPDEEKLIFSVMWLKTDTIGLATVNIDGSDLQIIDIPQGTLNDGPNISPDGEKILVVCEGVDVDSGQPGFMLCIMNLDGTGRTLLTKNGDSHGNSFFTGDSQKIIYGEYEHGGILGIINQPDYQIKIMDIDGNNKQTILNWHDPFEILAISENGDEIIFVDKPENGKSSRMYLLDQKGTNLRHLAYFDDFLADWFQEE